MVLSFLPQRDVAAAKRSLALAKLAALAGGGDALDRGDAAAAAELDGRLSLLALQVLPIPVHKVSVCGCCCGIFRQPDSSICRHIARQQKQQLLLL